MRSVATKTTQNGKTYYNFKIPHSTLKSIATVSPFLKDNLNGDQRYVSDKHVNQFASAIKYGKTKATRPNSIIASILGCKVRNEKDVAIGDSAVTIIEIEYDGLRIIDGQHSIAAVSILEDPTISDTWEWSVGGIPNAPDSECQLIHSGINMHQKRENKSVMGYSEFKNNIWGCNDHFVGTIVERMSSDENCALNGRIFLTHDDQTKRNIGFREIAYNLSDHHNGGSHSAFSEFQLDEEQAYKLTVCYFNEWRDACPKLWNDPVAYMFNDKMGLKVLSKLLYWTFKKAAKKYKIISEKSLKDVIQRAASKMKDEMWLNTGRKGKKNDRFHYSTERLLLQEMIKKLGFNQKKRYNGEEEITED